MGPKQVVLPDKRTLIMGILNVTPDSFSDGGCLISPQCAVEYAKKMVEDGADIIDIGGESSRPGASPVSVNEELERVIPVVQGVSDETEAVRFESGTAENVMASPSSSVAIKVTWILSSSFIVVSDKAVITGL